MVPCDLHGTESTFIIIALDNNDKDCAIMVHNMVLTQNGS